MAEFVIKTGPDEGLHYRGNWASACVQIPCPHCRAKKHQPCKTPNGRPARFHAARRYRVVAIPPHRLKSSETLVQIHNNFVKWRVHNRERFKGNIWRLQLACGHSVDVHEDESQVKFHTCGRCPHLPKHLRKQ